jgi:hypothetical protein
MKHLVLTLWFVLFLSSSALAGVEHVTEEVCHAIAGCWMNPKTGECPDCVLETREVAHTHEEEPVVVEKPIVRSIPKKEKLVNGYTRKVKWTCIIKPCDFIDENGNLIDES